MEKQKKKRKLMGRVIEMPSSEMDLELQALVDRELSGEDREKIITHIVLNPEARWRYEQLLRQKQLLQSCFACLKELH